jgi:hypothetical protein
MPKLFTLQEANNALSFVKPVVQDIKRLWDAMASEENQMKHLKRLEEVAQELLLVGCELKDIHSGNVDFPSLYKGELVHLNWQLGESSVNFWHKENDSFLHRMAIDEEFKQFNDLNLPDLTPTN